MKVTVADMIKLLSAYPMDAMVEITQPDGYALALDIANTHVEISTSGTQIFIPSQN